MVRKMSGSVIGQFTVATEGLAAEAEGASRVNPEKARAGLFSLLAVLVVMSPVVQNWRPEPADNFPLSHYPMFSYG